MVGEKIRRCADFQYGDETSRTVGSSAHLAYTCTSERSEVHSYNVDIICHPRTYCPPNMLTVRHTHCQDIDKTGHRYLQLYVLQKLVRYPTPSEC